MGKRKVDTQNEYRKLQKRADRGNASPKQLQRLEEVKLRLGIGAESTRRATRRAVGTRPTPTQEAFPIESSAQTRIDAERIAALQEKLEQSFDHFHSTVLAGIQNREAQVGTDTLFRQAIENPFHVINVNKNNQHSNAATLKEKARRQKRHLIYIARELLRDPRHFMYDIDQNEVAQMQGFAGFVPAERRMVLPSSFEERNALHFLVATHEIIHVMHGAVWRLQNENEYFEFYTRERPAVVLNEEFDAYAVEIETLNLLLMDELRQTIASGRPPDTDAIADRLGVRSEEYPPLNLVLRLAEKYYPSGSITVTQKPLDYRAQIARNQASYGYDLFMRDSQGLRQIV